MKEIQYRTFSLRIHKENWQLNKANSCQFELTFKCDLHCKHCCTDCYNRPDYLKDELTTKEVKLVLDKIHSLGVIWLCLTGGDPLTRADFLDIYSYAKEKGFLVNIFTNGYSITEEIVEYLKEKPPFVIEITLNAVTEELYEKMYQVKGAFKKAMEGIVLILKEGLPLKIKTQITKDNLAQAPQIKKFVTKLGLRFQPNPDLHSRLNGDLAPCKLRITPQEVLSLNGRGEPEDNCSYLPLNTGKQEIRSGLFRCAVTSGDGFYIDPYGNMFFCNLLRRPSFNLLQVNINYALRELLSSIRSEKFTTKSKCSSCNLDEFCGNCPGIAFLEKQDKEWPIEYYCELARMIAHDSNTMGKSGYVQICKRKDVRYGA